MKTLILLLSVLFTTMSFAQVPNYVPANGLVGWWPFNGNANDESGNGNNGTNNGATLTTDRNGNVNSAYSFDPNSNSNINIPFSSSLNSIQNGITLSAWIYMDGGTPAGTPPRILELRGAYGGGGDAGFVMLATDNNNSSRAFELKWYNNNDNSNLHFSPTNSTLTSLNWHLISFTADGIIGVAKYYFDGVLQSTSTNDIITQCNYNNNPLIIGAEPNLLGKWGGKLDDIGIWNRALTDCEIQNLYTSTNPSNTTTATACDSYLWNGTTYNASGVYTGTTTNCVTQALNLTINTNTSSSISQTALDSYTWPVNNQTYTTTGAYTAVIPNAAGCDSTITLNLTMSFTGINDLSASKLSIYPNPTNGDFTITGLGLLGSVSSLTLTDMNGKVVKVLDTKATKFSMGSIKPGVYFLNIRAGNKEEVLKIVKE